MTLNLKELGYTQPQIDLLAKISEDGTNGFSPVAGPSLSGAMTFGKQTTLKHLLASLSGDDKPAL